MARQHWVSSHSCQVSNNSEAFLLNTWLFGLFLLYWVYKKWRVMKRFSHIVATGLEFHILQSDVSLPASIHTLIFLTTILLLIDLFSSLTTGYMLFMNGGCKMFFLLPKWDALDPLLGFSALTMSLNWIIAALLSNF